MRKGKIEPQDEANPRPGSNRMSYLEMGVTCQRWARTGVSWWVNVLVVLFLVVICIALNLMCAGWYYGWDNLFRVLGWSN